MSPTSMAATDEKLRGTLIEASRDAWKNRLIDLSRRNNLLFYRPLVNGTLELPISPPLTQFVVEDGSMALTDLLPGQELKASNIRTIARKGLENLEEKGLSTLYLALGKCSWTAEDGGRDPFAPILLLPVSLKFKGHDIQSTEVVIAGEPEVNPVLTHVLDEEWNVAVKGEDLLQAFHPESEEDTEGGVPNQAGTSQPANGLEPVLELLKARWARETPQRRRFLSASLSGNTRQRNSRIFFAGSNPTASCEPTTNWPTRCSRLCRFRAAVRRSMPRYRKRSRGGRCGRAHWAYVNQQNHSSLQSDYGIPWKLSNSSNFRKWVCLPFADHGGHVASEGYGWILDVNERCFVIKDEFSTASVRLVPIEDPSSIVTTLNDLVRQLGAPVAVRCMGRVPEFRSDLVSWATAIGIPIEYIFLSETAPEDLMSQAMHAFYRIGHSPKRVN